MSETHWYQLPAERWRHHSKDERWWERDSQKQKLYDTESTVRWKCEALDRKLPSIEAIQRYVNHLTSEPWFLKCFGKYTIKVKNKSGSGADASYKTIRFSKWSRSIFVVLHEVAHVLHKPGYGSSHGRFYARTLIALVEHKIGNEAAKILKAEFRKGRVKYLPKRVLTDEAREKLRQSFKTRVLKQKVEV